MSTNILLAGDVHGELDLLYRIARRLEEQRGESLDMILTPGDFEPIRHEDDLRHYYAPPEHQGTGDFPEYFAGGKQAPIFTAFTGGNHEPWGHLAEVPHGGHVAPNILYLGRSTVKEIGGVRVAGITGIYDKKKYTEPRSPEPDFDWRAIRKPDVEELMGFEADILLMHDWLYPLPENARGRLLDFDRSHHPMWSVVREMRPQHVVMGHHHRFYCEAEWNDTKIHGLALLSNETIPLEHRARWITIE